MIKEMSILFISTAAALAFAGAGEKGHHHGESHTKMHAEHHGEQKAQGKAKHDAGMHGHHGHHAHDESLAGMPGKASEVDRVIEIEASDDMSFTPANIEAKDGETIRFVVHNSGQIKHEFSIGTKDEHKEHSEMMMANPDMHHGPGGKSITVLPGETKELIWKFEEAWQVEVACNMPGHYNAGMYSPVEFVEQIALND